MNDKPEVEEEISLMDLFDVLVRRKVLIIAVILLTVLASGGGVYVLRGRGPTVYEATATVTVPLHSPPVPSGNTLFDTGAGYCFFCMQFNEDSHLSWLLYSQNIISQLIGPGFTRDFYLSRVKDSELVLSIIEELALDPEIYESRGLEANMEAAFIDRTDTLELRVRDTNPQMAAAIANSWAAQFTGWVTDMIEGHITQLVRSVEERTDTAEQRLLSVSEEREKIWHQPPGVQELRKIIDAETELIAGYTIQLHELGMEETKLRLQRETIKEEVHLDTFESATQEGYPWYSSIETMQREIEAKTRLINEYEISLRELSIAEEKEHAVVANIRERLAEEPPFVNLTRTLMDESGTVNFTGENEETGEVAGVQFVSQEVNMNYAQLSSLLYESEGRLAGIIAQQQATLEAKKKLESEIPYLQGVLIEKHIDSLRAHREVLTEKIASLQQTASEHQGTLTFRQFEIENLEHLFETAKSNYESLNTTYQELSMALGVFQDEPGIMVLSTAVPPQRPVTPTLNLSLSLAVGLALGIILSLFAAFFAEFWGKYREYRKR